MKIYKKKKKEKGVSLSAMKDGDICKVLWWDSQDHADGRICQRNGLKLISLGFSVSSTWHTMFQDIETDHPMRVRILPKGTLLEI